MFCRNCGTEMNDNVCPNCGCREPEAQAADASEAAATEPAAAEPSAAEAALEMTEPVSSEAAAAEAAEPAAPKAAEPIADEPVAPETAESIADEPAAPETAEPTADEPVAPEAAAQQTVAPNAGQTPPYTPPAQPYTPPAGQPYAYGQPGQGYAPYGAPAAAADDKKATGLNVLSFFFPVVGLIIYLVTKKDKPVRAKSMGKSALGGFITWFVLTVILTILLVALGMYGFSVLQEETGGSFEAPYITPQEVLPDTNSENNTALDWQNMVVVIDETEIRLPCTYSEFEQQTGYALEDSEERTALLGGNELTTTYLSAENTFGQVLSLRFFNSGTTDSAIEDCKVGDVYDLNAFREKFGETENTYTGDSGYATVSWVDANDSYNELEITTYDGQTVEEISLDVYPAE